MTRSLSFAELQYYSSNDLWIQPPSSKSQVRFLCRMSSGIQPHGRPLLGPMSSALSHSHPFLGIIVLALGGIMIDHLSVSSLSNVSQK